MAKRTMAVLFSIVLTALAWGKPGYFYTTSTRQLTSSKIQSVLQDSRGFLWISTEFGLNRFDGYTFSSYFNVSGVPNSICFNSTICLFNDRDGNLWVGTVKGLDRYDPMTDGFVHYKAPQDQQPRVNCITQLRDGRIIVGTSGYGIFQIDEKNHRLVALTGLTSPSAKDYCMILYEDSKGNIWKTGTDNVITKKEKRGKGRIRVFNSPCGIPVGVLEVDGRVCVVCSKGVLVEHNGKLQRSTTDFRAAGLDDVLFYSCYKDSKGNVFLGTRGHGLFVFRPSSHKIEPVTFQSDQIDLMTAKVACVTEDRQHNLWIGCLQRGLVMIPYDRPQFHSLNLSERHLRVGTTVSSVCEGDDGMVWCAVQGNGIYGLSFNGDVVAHPSCPKDIEFLYRDMNKNYWVGTDNALFSYNPATGSSEKVFTYDCNRFNTMTADRYGNLYVSTFARGLCVRSAATGKWTNYNFKKRDSKHGYLCNNWVLALMPDSRGMVWIATSSGVQAFDPRTASFQPLGWHKQLEGVMCLSLCETRSGDILIGTDHGLYVYSRKTRKVAPFAGAEQLAGKIVAYIVQDRKGDIWCATSYGIWQWQSDKRRFVCHVRGNGLVQKEYVNCVGLHMADDRICFATSDGIVTFRPDEVRKCNNHTDELQLTSLMIGGAKVNSATLSDGRRITDTDVMNSKHFEVSFSDNSLTLHFSQLNFVNPENVVICYRVNGARTWTYNQAGDNTITLSHLPPGSYRLEVCAFANGAFSRVKAFTVTVLPPWYRSTYAILIYVLIALVVIGGGVFFYLRRKRAQLDEEKMKFLINATHDIRSPLTLIISPLRKLMSSNLGENAQAELATIERNAKRILTLVNQILDMRKIDKQQMHLVCRETDLVQFVNGVCKMYEYNAKERGITFHFNHKMGKLKVWIDTVNFDKVVSNLLSNAFKYTADGGKIDVDIMNEDDRWAVIQVKDTGIGLSEDGGKRIFDRFYQGKSGRDSKTAGTGIGLNLCKMIVDMHYGEISAGNREDGVRGSVFTVKVPLGTAHLTKEEMDQTPEPVPAKSPQVKKVGTKRSYRVMVVDDDEELARYISSELSRYYRFTVCSNGREAIKELLCNDYDVVVSDVMMPEMDGFSLLRLIKTNVRLNHIPVIMLTSKNDVVNRLEGLERGADAYMSKPFDIQELHLMIENQMNNILLLKGKFSGAQQAKDKVAPVTVKGNDDALMERIMKSINKNFANSDFNVDMLTEEVGISRAQLHRKMKEMTGIPASEFLRNIRLEQAARLLKEQKVNVTQVAYSVGFSNLAHFSTIFRRHFGVSPTEFAERSQKEQPQDEAPEPSDERGAE